MRQLGLQKGKWSSSAFCVWLVIVLIASSFSRAAAQQPRRNVAKEAARPTRDWVNDTLIYEIYTRAFSAGELQRRHGAARSLEGSRRHDPLADAHSSYRPGKERRGRLGAPTQCVITTASNFRLWHERRPEALDQRSAPRGLKVVIDIVANHTSWDSVLMKNPDFYKHDASGKITYPHDWFRYRRPQL
jgi:hypothetical protein